MGSDGEELAGIALVLTGVGLLLMPVVGFVAWFGVWMFKVGWKFAEMLVGA